MTGLLIVDGTSWGDVWAMTGMGFGVVFAILVLLVFILMAFGAFAKSAPKKASASVAQPTAAAKSLATASDQDKAAVAMALYLYYKDVHDEETGVITIKHNARSAWHHELNKRINQE